MMMLLLALALGFLVGLAGQLLAPAGGPALPSTLRASWLGALPGGLAGLVSCREELLMGLDARFLVMCIVGSVFAVLSVTFGESLPAR